MHRTAIRLQIEENLALVELDRPAVRNALDIASLRRLLDLLTELRQRDEIHGVLLCAGGPDFCAGADLHEIRSFSPLDATRFAELGQAVTIAMERLGKPLIAAVQGHVLGAGLELALAADFIVAAEDARLGFREIEYGIIPGFGGTQRLTRRVGKARAKELIFGATIVDGSEARRIGLVNRIHPADELRAAACELLATICSRGLFSLRLAKEVIDAGSGVNLSAALLMERDAFAVCFATEDQKEGMGAFVEKRPARFKGR